MNTEARHEARHVAATKIFAARKARRYAGQLEHMVLDAIIDANIMMYLATYDPPHARGRRHFMATMFLTGDEQKEVGLK